MENCIGITTLIRTGIVATVAHTLYVENEPTTQGFVRLENAIKRRELYTNEGRNKIYRVFK